MRRTPSFARAAVQLEPLERRDTPAFTPYSVDAAQISTTQAQVVVVDGDPNPGDNVEDTAGVVADIYYNGTLVDTIDSPDLNFTFGGLPVNTRVDVTVYAYDFDGFVSDGVTTSFLTDSAGSVSVQGTSSGTTSGRIVLTSDISTDWTYYVTDDTGASYHPYATTTATSVDVVGLTAGVTYYAYAEGVNRVGDVIQSNVTSFTTDSVSIGDETVTVVATGPTGVRLQLTSEVQTGWTYHLSEGGDYHRAATTTDTVVDLAGLTPGVTYYVYADGFDRFGNYRVSNVVRFTTDRLLPEPVRPVAVGGATDGSVRLVTSSAVTMTLSPFGNTGTATRTASADVDRDGTADVVAVTGPGTPLRVAVLSGTDGSVLVAPFDPFGGDFPGGGYVAAADLDGDGRAEFVVTPGQGGGPRVTIFTRNPDGTLGVRANFFGIDDPGFRGGARAAVGDVNGDGTPDVIVAAGFGGGPRTAIFTGQSVLAGAPARLVNDFFAFPGSDAQTLRNGSFVAAGDLDGDGKADLIFGGGPGGAPRVFALSGAAVSAGDVGGAQARPLANFFVGGDLSDRGGARVGVTNADGDGRADLAVGSGAGRPAKLRLYAGAGFPAGGEPAAVEIDPLGSTVLGDGLYVG